MISAAELCLHLGADLLSRAGNRLVSNMAHLVRERHSRGCAGLRMVFTSKPVTSYWQKHLSSGPERRAVLWCVQLCTDMHHSWLLRAALGLPEPWGISVQPQPCRGSSTPACFISKHMNIALEHHVKGMV